MSGGDAVKLEVLVPVQSKVVALSAFSRTRGEWSERKDDAVNGKYPSTHKKEWPGNAQ
jgi:hypothetical protein